MSLTLMVSRTIVASSQLVQMDSMSSQLDQFLTCSLALQLMAHSMPKLQSGQQKELTSEPRVLRRKWTRSKELMECEGESLETRRGW